MKRGEPAGDPARSKAAAGASDTDPGPRSATAAQAAGGATHGQQTRPFDAPWQAEAFALTVALNEAGHLEWSAWARIFSATLAQYQPASAAGAGPAPAIRDDADSNTQYWRAWVAALEQVVRERGFAAPLQLGAHREAVRAFRRVGARNGLFRPGDEAAEENP